MLHPLALLACAPFGPQDPATTTWVATTPPPVSSSTIWPPPLTAAAEIDPDIPSLVRVRWTQPNSAPAHIRYRVTGEDWRQTPEVFAPAGRTEQLLLGLPYSTRVEFQAVTGARSGPTGQITTGPLSGEVPVPEVWTANPERWDDASRYLLVSTGSAGGGLGSTSWTSIIDRQGRVVWAVESPVLRITFQPQPSGDGRSLLIDRGSFWGAFDGGASSTVIRITLDGAVLEEIDTPGLHHPFTELPDGTLLWGAYGGDDETLEARGADDSRWRLWSCAEHHAALGVEVECGSNSITYNTESDSLLYSFYSTETVHEIDRETGELMRSYGHLPDAWGFDPEDAAFWWQHGARVTADGTLLVSAQISEDDEETVVREYIVDTESERLEQIWTFGEGSGIWAPQMGEAERLPGGNTLHNLGTASRLREVTPDGEIVWDVFWPDNSWIGRTTMLDDLYALASPVTER